MFLCFFGVRANGLVLETFNREMQSNGKVTSLVHGTEKIINRKLVLEVSYIIITSAETPTDDVDQQLENTNRNMKTSRTTKDGNWKRGNLAETQPMMNRPPSKHQNDLSSREPANYSAISTSLF